MTSLVPDGPSCSHFVDQICFCDTCLVETHGGPAPQGTCEKGAPSGAAPTLAGSSLQGSDLEKHRCLRRRLMRRSRILRCHARPARLRTVSFGSAVSRGAGGTHLRPHRRVARPIRPALPRRRSHFFYVSTRCNPRHAANSGYNNLGWRPAVWGHAIARRSRPGSLDLAMLLPGLLGPELLRCSYWGTCLFRLGGATASEQARMTIHPCCFRPKKAIPD